MSIFGKPKLSEAERTFNTVVARCADDEMARDRAKVAEAAATRALSTAEETLFVVEGDCYIGRVPSERLEAARQAVADAKIAVTRTAAEAREAERRLCRSERAVEIYKPQIVAAQVRGYHGDTRDILARMKPLFAQLEALNNELHDTFVRAADEFPAFYLPYYEAQRQGRDAVRPYPVNAGLPNLAWPEFRQNPHAANGGRLGTWLEQAEQFLRDSDEMLKGQEV